MAVNAFNINARYRSRQICVSSELAWSIQQVPGKLKLCTEAVYTHIFIYIYERKLALTKFKDRLSTQDMEKEVNLTYIDVKEHAHFLVLY